MVRFLFVVVILTLNGCAATQNIPMDRAEVPALKDKRLTVVIHESPSFVAMTSGKGMFAVAGVAAAVSAGDQLVQESQLVDPAMHIGEQLAQNLNTRYGTYLNSKESLVVSSTDAQEVARGSLDTDYVLGVETNGWSFMYDGFKFSEYLVGYSVKTRLITAMDGKTVSQGFCSYDTKTAGKPNVSYETLVANDAAYIKQSLEDATTFCVEKFKTELF